MDVELELRIHERRDDRVVVALRVRPGGEAGAFVDGAALHLVDASGEELCPQVLLPLSGPLSGPVCLNVELRGNRKLPEGCRVVGLVWQGAEQVTTTCPADPDVSFAEFLRGSRHGLPADDSVELFTLDDVQSARLTAIWPWVTEPIRASAASEVLDAGPSLDDAESLGEDLGLDEESAEWLHELLHEAEP